MKQKSNQVAGAVILVGFAALFAVRSAESQDARADLAFNARLQLSCSPALVADGWIALFDGETLFGWRAESDADWRVSDGCICVSAGEPGLLRTTSQFSDFELYLEFQAEPDTNSGIFIHTPPRPTDPQVDCYEINIAPESNPFPTGSIVGRENGAHTARTDGFRQLQIRAEKGHLQVHVDGAAVTDYADERWLGRGYIGLQLNSGAVSFRNIRLRPLGGRDLMQENDWEASGTVNARFGLSREARLHVLGGPGHLESRDRYRDFVLQLEAETIGVDQNSGVFFRSIPGSRMDGYESQIDHEFLEADRRLPADYGTGGIFARQHARRVVSSPDAWFAKTIVACGPHISVWVNGYQVVDWTDQRLADPNPRRGRRLEQGSLMIQAHDAGTNIFFREFRVAELAPRVR